MQKGSKRISNSLRPKISTVKCLIRDAIRPFDGEGYIFKTAVRELRKEGLIIIHDSKKCQYYLKKD